MSEHPSDERRERLRSFQEQVLAFAERLRDEAVHLSRIARAKLDVLGFRREMNRIYLLLGKRAHELTKEGHVTHDEIRDLSKRVSDLEREVGKVEEGISALKETRKERREAAHK